MNDLVNDFVYELHFFVEAWHVILVWHVLLFIVWLIIRTRLFPWLVWKYQVYQWRKAGEPEGDPYSPTAVVAFSRNMKRPFARDKRIRMFIRRHEGWIDTEWLSNGEGPVWSIVAEPQEGNPVDTLIGDLQRAGWFVLTVQIPRAHVWHTARVFPSVALGCQLTYARTLLQVHPGHAPTVWWLFQYLKLRRSHSIVTPPAPTRRGYTQAMPEKPVVAPVEAEAA